MNNKQRLKGFVGFSASDETIEGVLIDFNIDPALTYNASNIVLMKRAAIEVLKVLASSPDITNDTGFTHKYDRAAVQKRINDLTDELDPVDIEPKIRSKTHMW